MTRAILWARIIAGVICLAWGAVSAIGALMDGSTSGAVTAVFLGALLSFAVAPSPD